MEHRPRARRSEVFRLLTSAATLLLAQVALGAGPPPYLRGFVEAHDPSTIIKCKDRYYAFWTRQGIGSKSSADKVLWSAGPNVFASPPAWTTAAVPGFTGVFWAPDILFFNNKYYLYYSVSTWGSQVSAIGLVTNPTLDPSDPAYQWTDQGPVIQSGAGSPYNCIDPSLTWDAAGNLWMAFGSYWNGIYLVQLNATNGLRIATNSPTYHLASNSSIEANCTYRRGGYYYLFVNWGSCCDGVDSTYNIRVGRSTSITGPYLDRNGINLANGGGGLFMRGNGKFTGPGHVAILREGGSEWFSYHYYDANDWSPGYGAFGEAKFELAPLNWTDDDWPEFNHDWSAIYPFLSDARDDNGQYYGLLQNGAAIQNDPTRGRVLNLDGTNQYVWLPPGVGYAKTFAAVVKWRGGGPWQRIFDFGFDTSRTVMLTASGNGVLRCDLNPGGNLQILQWTQPLPTNVWTHVAVTLDGTRGVLYVNGSAVATNAGMTALPVDVRPQTNHLGRSKFAADAYFNGQYSSFRVYGKALSAAEIVAPLAHIDQPLNGSLYVPGSTVAFAGRATDFADVPLGPTNLNWRVEYTQDGQTNVVFGPVSGVTNGTFNIPTNATGGGTYTIVLTALDGVRQKAVTATLWPAHPPTEWSSYYPLKADAGDANGHYPGTLFGGASFVNDPARGNVLNLSGSTQYVRLPAGVAGMQTFMAWVKWNGGAAWQRIFDFGNDTTHYTMLSPSAANGKLRANISLNSIPGEQIVDAPAALPVGTWTHVAVTMDGSRMILYTNGVPVATNLNGNLVPAHLKATNNFLGKSNWPDPYFSGRLSAVRVFSRPLTANEILSPQVTIDQPAHGATYQPAQTILFAGSATDFFDAQVVATGLTWTVRSIAAGVTNTVFGPAAGITNGSFAIASSGAAATNGQYQVMLTAVDAAGRRTTNSVNIYSGSLPTEWASFYPFNTGAQDSSNRFNGTLQGGASIQADAARGNVLNLSGSGQYVQLPAGASAAQTISGWVKWRGGGAWQRVFDFGRNTQQWFFLTPRTAASNVQCAITTDNSSYSRAIESPGTLPLNQWTHVAVVLDGKQGILFLDGKAVAVNNSVNLLPSDIGASNCYLGRSQFPADPYFNGQIDSLALNSSARSLDQLLGPVSITANLVGNDLNLSWPIWAGSLSLHSASNLSPPVVWTAVTNAPVIANGMLNLVLPCTNSSQFYRLQSP